MPQKIIKKAAKGDGNEVDLVQYACVTHTNVSYTYYKHIYNGYKKRSKNSSSQSLPRMREDTNTHGVFVASAIFTSTKAHGRAMRSTGLLEGVAIFGAVGAVASYTLTKDVQLVAHLAGCCLKNEISLAV